MSYILSSLVLQKSLTILDLEVIIPFSVGLLRTIQLLNATFLVEWCLKMSITEQTVCISWLYYA